MHYLYLRPHQVQSCNQYQEGKLDAFMAPSEPPVICPEQCATSRLYYAQAHQCNPRLCSLSVFSSDYWDPPEPLDSVKPTSEVLNLEKLAFDHWEIMFLFLFLAFLNIYRSAHSLAPLLPDSPKTMITIAIAVINSSLLIMMALLFPIMIPIAVIIICYTIGIDKDENKEMKSGIKS